MSIKNFERRYEEAKKEWNSILSIYDKTSQPILLFGPPGTGKSAFAVYLGRKRSKEVEVFNVNKFSSKPDILGHFISTPGGSTFCFNAGARAMMHGRPLVLNEIDHGGPEIMSTLHFICDHQTVAQETLPDGNGTVLKASPGYRVIATMNGDPINLPLAIRDRFQIQKNILLANPDAVDTLPDTLRQFAYCDGVTLRNLIAVQDLMDAGYGNMAECFRLVLGNASSEISEALAIAAVA